MFHMLEFYNFSNFLLTTLIPFRNRIFSLSLSHTHTHTHTRTHYFFLLSAVQLVILETIYTNIIVYRYIILISICPASVVTLLVSTVSSHRLTLITLTLALSIRSTSLETRHRFPLLGLAAHVGTWNGCYGSFRESQLLPRRFC